MWGLIIEGAILAADFIYHRYMVPKPPPSKVGGQAVTLPRTDFGGPVPLVFGWTNVKSPFLAYAETPQVGVRLDGSGNEMYRTYGINMMFVCGIPMGVGVTHGNRLAGPKLTKLWYGDKLLPGTGSFPTLDGANIWDAQNVIQPGFAGGEFVGGGLFGTYWWFGGWSDQRFDFPSNRVGDAMATKALAARGDNQMFGGLPNQMCIAFAKFAAPDDADATMIHGDALSSFVETLPASGFCFGESPNINGISVEVQTYGDVVSGVTQHIFAMNNPTVDFGGDADPIEVIYDLLVGGIFGKMRLPASLIDLVSFGAASATLKAEGHGYSRAFEEAMSAADMINDVLKQIDAALDIDPATGKLVIKLIRNDYDPNLIPHITAANGCELQNVKIGGWTGVPNKIKVTYPDRSKGYAVMPVTAQNLANAVGQDGLVVESEQHYEGVKNGTLAQTIADRELAANSRPLITCTALLDGSFRYLKRGDAVKLTWTKPDIAGLVFRVANVSRGTMADGRIKVDLIQDYYYVYRNNPPTGGHLGGIVFTGGSGLTRG